MVIWQSWSAVDLEQSEPGLLSRSLCTALGWD